jgi:glutathione S-transferase
MPAVIETSPHPILYSFRRCPYAMRARLAIITCAHKVELRDILLKDKPVSMVTASPKATVPVLVLSDATVVDESLDVMHWAFKEHGGSDFYPTDPALNTEIETLIAENDGPFKSALDRYKYFVRFPEAGREDYRSEGELFLQKLENRLQQTAHLFGNQPTYGDLAIFPFIRQFANSDKVWFDQAPYPAVQNWLSAWLSSDAFVHTMKKRPIWNSELPPVYFPELKSGEVA